MRRQTFRYLCQIMLVSAMVLPCSRAFGQGCGLEPEPGSVVECISGPQVPSTCTSFGDPSDYCSINYSECLIAKNRYQRWTVASSQPDPDECGGGGGGECSGRCLETGCPPTYTCDASTCGCVYLFGEVKGQGNRTKRGCSNRAPATTRARPMVLSSGNYRDGGLYEGLLLVFSQDKGQLVCPN
jgi:hypothetical protein